MYELLQDQCRHICEQCVGFILEIFLYLYTWPNFQFVYSGGRQIGMITPNQKS